MTQIMDVPCPSVRIYDALWKFGIFKFQHIINNLISFHFGRGFGIQYNSLL